MDVSFDGKQKIDMKDWKRRDLFRLFQPFSEPYHGICLRVDCTETFKYAKAHGLSVFLSFLHRSLAAAQIVENFRVRILDGAPWMYDVIHGGSAVGRSNGTIGFGYYNYQERINDFVRDAAKEVERVKGRTDLERRGTLNVIRYSTLPWMDFTSLSHARDATRNDSAPLITFGKMTQANGHRTMPVSIHVHHALADGLHVAQFVEMFQKLLDAPEEIPGDAMHYGVSL